jgi:hypothetical protein
LRSTSRKKYRAYDGINNIFNLAYEVLSWKVHRALVKAKLEPYLGFLHSIQFGKPSLVCDFIELYRYLIDDFLIQYCQNIKRKDFTVKTERLSRNKKAKREYLNDSKASNLMMRLNALFESEVEIPRIKHGNRQSIETLINVSFAYCSLIIRLLFGNIRSLFGHCLIITWLLLACCLLITSSFLVTSRLLWSFHGFFIIEFDKPAILADEGDNLVLNPIAFLYHSNIR